MTNLKEIEVFDPRVFATTVYGALSGLRKDYDDALNSLTIEKDQRDNHLKEQKNQAVELYTYLSTWGLMRLKAEESILNKEKLNCNSPIEKRIKASQYGKYEVVHGFFKSLENLISNSESEKTELKLDNLLPDQISVDQYLGTMGVALALAQEFSFWANAIYHDINGDR